MKTVYADCNSTTQIDPRVLEVIAEANQILFANPASIQHCFGQSAQNAVQKGREQIAALIGSDADSIVFTSGATEANNIVLYGVTQNIDDSAESRVIATATDHKAILDPLADIKAKGYQTLVTSVDSTGQVNLDECEDMFNSETVLATVIFANNEVGTINRINDIGKMCVDHEILFHVDATQAAGKIPIDVRDLPIDLMSFSAHKMYGPKGVGALYIRDEEIRKRIRPIIYGGGHERGLRSGTLPVPLIVGFAKACQLCQENMDEEKLKIGQMRDRLWDRFQSEIPDVILNGHPTERLYNNLNVSFLGVPSEAFLIKLRDVVAVSPGSACTSANPEPSHVLRAMNVGHERLESAIRFGLGRFNTMEEVEYVADHVRDAVAELRKHL